MMKKKSVTLLMVLTIAISGVAGFSGIYLMCIFIIILSFSFEGGNSLASNSGFELDTEQLNAYLDGYFVSLNIAEVLSEDIYLLNSTNNLSKFQQLTIPKIAKFASNNIVEIYTESAVSSGRMKQFVTDGTGAPLLFQQTDIS